MGIEVGPLGLLVKVISVENDRVFFELRNGNAGWMDHPLERFAVGDVLLISEDRQGVERVATSAWPEELWIGVVKVKLPDITIIDSELRYRTVPTTEYPPYEVGNTVQAGDTQGVTRILSERPISRSEAPPLDDTAVDQFRWEPPDGKALTFEDFGGLEAVVFRARELIEVPLQNREALADIGARPIKGVLFTGEPGTGKTMLAQIIASQSNATFYKISGPEVFSKWYGQSEEIIRRVFDTAAMDEKAIIFFDEIDSIAAQRDDRSHEVTKRVVAQLLTRMDGFDSKSNVVVIAATNRPKDIDAALRRPGRFDWVIEFPYPDESDRADILAKGARHLRTRDPLPHQHIAARTSGWSAAELAAIWSEAALLAVQDGRSAIYDEDYLGGFERVSRSRSTAAALGEKRGDT